MGSRSRRTNEAQSAGDVTSTIPEESSAMQGSTTRINQVRTFGNFVLKEERFNLVFASSIVVSLWKERSFLQVLAIHGYKGATTEDELNFGRLS